MLFRSILPALRQREAGFIGTGLGGVCRRLGAIDTSVAGFFTSRQRGFCLTHALLGQKLLSIKALELSFAEPVKAIYLRSPSSKTPSDNCRRSPSNRHSTCSTPPKDATRIPSRNSWIASSRKTESACHSCRPVLNTSTTFPITSWSWSAQRPKKHQPIPDTDSSTFFKTELP